jgi:Na+(H+)/acetate symporter ActP
VIDFQILSGREFSLDPAAGEPASPAGANPQRFLRLSRWMTLFWGLVLIVLGTFQWGPMLEAGLTIASITFGSLLGLFLLAFLIRQATASGVLIGMFVGFAAILWIHFYTPLLWTWYVLTGATITFLTGAVASLATTPATPPRQSR